MKFRFELKPDLPRLAWAARMSAHEDVVHVVHGPWVELRDDAFVEGAWNGPFDEFRFDQAVMLIGSGGRVTSDGVIFAGQSDVHERLYVIRRDGVMHASPSLALVLAVADASLDPSYPDYYPDSLKAYQSGIREKRKYFPLADGLVAEMHDGCTLRVSRDLEIERFEKPWPPAPADFASYKSLMQATLDSVLRNADDPKRQHRFRPVCTISRGYDSVAVAVLAANAGCREAVTYRQSGSAKGRANDDGSVIGDVLGYRTTVYDRPLFRGAVREGEEEFYLESLGVDRELLPMEAQLAGSVLLTARFTSGWQAGHNPEWGLPGSGSLPDFQQYIARTPGCALTDFRMRVGFLHYNVPSICAIHAPALLQITISPEMRPWSVGGAYDRPVPRRIAEEAGVPRHVFGYTKMGGPIYGVKRRPGPARRVLRRLVAPLRALLPRKHRNDPGDEWRAHRDSVNLQSSAAKVVERYRRALQV